MTMNILIVGSGGREHALAWKVAQSSLVNKVFVAPGNAGTAMEFKIKNVNIHIDDIDSLITFAKDHNCHLTIIGPELPLVNGIVDRFKEAQLKCFGPKANCAQLEGSKAFAKDFLIRHNIPTAEYATFFDLKSATAYLQNQEMPIVVKMDGLAAGKGVFIADDLRTAEAKVKNIFSEGYSDSSTKVVIEKYLHGEEVSFIVMSDGKNILPLATSQDYKRIWDGDTGENTGGMGACSPSLIVNNQVYNRIMHNIVFPTIKGLATDGQPYVGFLYIGLIIMNNGTLKVIEYNCRSGDPETQSIMIRMKSDLVKHCLAAIDGRLNNETILWNHNSSLSVVLATYGYPNNYRKGSIINGLPTKESRGIKVFHAGTSFLINNNKREVITAGGRVLCVTALGKNISEAKKRAYKLADAISWQGVYCRRDIGHLSIAREATS